MAKVLQFPTNKPKSKQIHSCSSGDFVYNRYEQCPYVANDSGMCPRHEALARYRREKDTINA